LSQGARDAVIAFTLCLFLDKIIFVLKELRGDGSRELQLTVVCMCRVVLVGARGRTGHVQAGQSYRVSIPARSWFERPVVAENAWVITSCETSTIQREAQHS